MTYLTTIERFLDNLGVWRYENVSWVIYRQENMENYLVKDIDDRWFECPIDKFILTQLPSQLINVDIHEYIRLKRTKNISDFNTYYKKFGVDQEANTRAMHRDGVLDPEKKKKLINTGDHEDNNYESERDKVLKRNLYITD